MVKIRLQGLPEEVNKAKEELRKVFRILYESNQYQNRNSEYVRVYIEAEPSYGKMNDGKV